jgi:hypothetical protein
MGAMRDVEFQKITRMEVEIQSRDYCIIQIKSTLNCWPMKTKLTCFVGNGSRMPDMEFQENPSNGRQHTAERILCSPSKVTLIIDWSRWNLTVSWGMRAEWYKWNFRKISQTEDEIQPKRLFALQVKYPSLPTDRDQTYTFHRAWAKVVRYGDSVTFLISKKRYSRLGTPLSKLSAIH